MKLKISSSQLICSQLFLAPRLLWHELERVHLDSTHLVLVPTHRQQFASEMVPIQIEVVALENIPVLAPVD